ncbi:MAG: hypothetical protein C0392_05620 [Syntrophus sp. (in: bacteria)]|nr:hypothetical protein [Syntrophus sp. (in: bacteria)]
MPGDIVMMEKQKILIIDDDLHIRKTLSDIMKAKGYEPLVAKDGTEGLELLKQSQVNLVIIDLGLPDMTGLEVLSRIKTDNPFTEAIVLTGDVSIDSAIEATNKGAFSYLLKPFEIDQLMLQIRRALEEQQAQVTIARYTIELERTNAQLRAVNTELMKEVAERKKAEEGIQKLLKEKELLLREVHHRIKNNMNVIMSLLSLQSSILKDPSAIAALEDSRSRVQSMMVLYDKLYRSTDFREISTKDYLTSLIDEIVGNFVNRGSVTIETHIDNSILDAKILSYVGMILNELLTNAIKHAFIGKDNGVIAISFSLEDNHATLIIQDNGIGIPETIDIEISGGFGMQLVGMLTKQLEGIARIERHNGSTFILEFEV